MQVFGDYARYYNLLYRDKDYQGEAEFVHELLRKYAPTTKSFLELGCGTGKHAEQFVKWGYEVCGVDLSADMLAQAEARSQHLPPEQSAQLEFHQGDIRNFRLHRQFDAVISLFHVFSYQTTNQDLQAAFATAKAHLKPGGVLIFDCWYGPGVLSDRPTVRVKRLDDEEITVTRIAEPILDVNENLVTVNYQVLIKNSTTQQTSELQESHQMRYLFKPEIDLLLQYHQLELMAYGEWMTNRIPNDKTWNVYAVAKSIGAGK